MSGNAGPIDARIARTRERLGDALVALHDASTRVAPVCELFAHVGEGQKLYQALVASGRIRDFLALAQGHFARTIEQRLR